MKASLPSIPALPGPLISPAMVEEFMMPCYDRIVAFARAHGVRLVSVDTDGDCSELVPLMMKHGINMFFPFEVQAGTLKKAEPFSSTGTVPTTPTQRSPKFLGTPTISGSGRSAARSHATPFWPILKYTKAKWRR